MMQLSLNTLFDDKRMTIAVVYVWFVMLILMFWQLGIFQSEFMSFGPNDHLTYMGVNVDNWGEYSLIAAYIGISTFVNDLAGDSIGPFLSNNIADFKTRVLPYQPRTCLIISQMWSLYCSVASIASLYVAFSQADLLVLRILVDLCVNYYTTSRYIRNKKYDPVSYRKFFDDEADELSEMITTTLQKPATDTLKESDVDREAVFQNNSQPFVADQVSVCIADTMEVQVHEHTEVHEHTTAHEDSMHPIGAPASDMV
jgi:hypothetical protein